MIFCDLFLACDLTFSNRDMWLFKLSRVGVMVVSDACTEEPHIDLRAPRRRRPDGVSPDLAMAHAPRVNLHHHAAASCAWSILLCGAIVQQHAACVRLVLPPYLLF